MFNDKQKELREKQAEVRTEMAIYEQADENYYITASTVLNLAQRALSIFQNSEVMEKRQLLNFLLQNAQLQGKNLVFTLKAPFDTVLEANRCVEMLPSPQFIITIEDWEYMAGLREKVSEIKKL